MLLTGNPRTDQMGPPSAEAALAELGIVGDFVVWMPTFRRPRAVGSGPGATTTARSRSSARPGELAAGLRERGLQLVVKPHPMDADRRRWPGVSVDEADPAAAG